MPPACCTRLCPTVRGSAAVSESECLRCFRAAIGTPPIRYLKQFRVQKAAALLLSTGWNAAEIGARCGFQDASYFASTFRQLKGCTPSEYRGTHASGKYGRQS